MAIVDPEHWFLDADRLPRGPSFTRGNFITAFIDGQAYMADLQRVLATCDRQLYMAGWEFSGDQRLNATVANGIVQGETLVDAVSAAARRGCEVKALIFDVPTTSLPAHFQHLHAPANLAFARAVNAAGGDAILDGRLARTPTISSHHQKFVIAVSSDSQSTAGYIGGIDLALDRWDTPQHNSPPERQRAGCAAWHDVQARVQGPAVAQLWHAFRARWNDPRQSNHQPALEAFRGRSRIDGAPPACVDQAGTMAIQVHQTLPAGVFPEHGGPGERSIELAHQRAIERAQHYIYIEDQYVWPCSLVDPVEDALERGVHVVMVVAREDMTHAARMTSSRLRHEVVQRFIKAGGDRFHIFHLEQPFGEREQIYVHSKLMIVDDCYVSIGSANFNGRSMTNDTEIEIGIVDEDLVETTVDGQPARVCRFAHELRCRLWAEHFERPVESLRDPIAAIARLWPEGEGDDGRRAQPHHVSIGILNIDPIAEHITTLIMDRLVDIPFIELPAGVVNRNAVKLLVNVALRGPRRAVLMEVVEESFNPSLAPVLNAVGSPITSAWRRHWARRAAHAVGFIGQRSPVSAVDLEGQEFVESRAGVQIFRLADGRYHVVSHFAVPSLETARSAAIAISGDTD